MENEIGKKIQYWMGQRGISRKDLCEQTHLTEAALSRYVNGLREPRSITLAAIAKALDVSTDELLGTKCEDPDTIEGAVALVARSADSMSEEQKKRLVSALLDL